MKRFAFTMLELVFVIIIIGILAVLAMPNFNTNPLRLAAEQVATHIRYTQHLAMVDDKFDPTDARFHSLAGYNPANDGQWYKEFWRIRFYTDASGNKWYAVFNDKDREGQIDINTHIEPAIDPLTGKFLFGLEVSSNTKNNQNMNLTKTFGITEVNATCDTGNIDFFFDHLGRPYIHSVSTNPIPPYSNLLANDCNITLVHPDGIATISVYAETGYVSVN